MWAYPNFIPLSPSVLQTMWDRLKPYDFRSVHSLFVGRDIRGLNIKAEVLDNMKLQAQFQGYEKHPIFEEEWDSGTENGSFTLSEQSELSPQQPTYVGLERNF